MPTIEANESISNFPISDCIVAAYRCIPQVTAIYIDSYKVWIVTNDRHYDTDLWERCYDAECAVLNRYPAMEMTRLPAGIFDDPLTAIPKRARKIYEAIGHSDDTQPEDQSPPGPPPATVRAGPPDLEPVRCRPGSGVCYTFVS